MTTQQRKKDHIRICVNEKVETESLSFKDIMLVHSSMPEINFNEIDTGVNFLGKHLRLPLLMAAITGGTEESKKINRSLAEVAEKKGIGFSLGSQRAMIEDAKLKDTYFVRDVAPKTIVLGNIGITQLHGIGALKIRGALEAVGADAVCVHINSPQEVFQKEGDTDFKGMFSNLKDFCKGIGYPVIAKEVGFGINRETAIRLKECGVSAIDVGGYGGTNWVVVDGYRSGLDYKNFSEWGIPTPISVLESKAAGVPLVATGGIRTGFDIAKSIALGADLCGIALPFLKALVKGGREEVSKYVDSLERELKFAMFLTGSKSIGDLKKAKYVLSGRTKEWAEQRKLL